MDDKKSYLYIPGEILGRVDLNISDKLVYGFIISFKNKVCYTSNITMEKRLGVKKRTLQRSLTRLQENGFIFIKNPHSKNREIHDIFNKPNKYKFLSNSVQLNGRNNGGK